MARPCTRFFHVVRVHFGTIAMFVFVLHANQAIVPWTVINVKASINFEKLLVQIKSNNFSFIINIGFWLDKSTDNSTVYRKNYTL